jgi:hypothetical protein
VGHVGRHVLMDLFAAMESVLIFEMIHAIVVLVFRSVLDKVGAPLQCVIIVDESC